jgi:excisionase family DNA binding protein
MYDLKEVAKILKLSRPTVKRLITDDEIKVIRITKTSKQLVTDEELQRFLNTKIKG